MTINMQSLSLKDLKEWKSQEAKAITSFEDRKKKDAVAELEDRARQMGFTLAELLGTQPVRKRAPAAAKYANPANSSDTWSGRGRKPRWFEAALAEGKSAEDMAI